MQLTQTQLTEMNTRGLTIVDGIIIHHSVADKTLDISEIAAMEQASQGFITVGYHCYLKCVDVEKDEWVAQMGRPIEYVPAAALGYNTRSIDICFGGNYHPGGASFLDKVSPNAIKVAVAFIETCKRKCPNIKYLDGHRDVATWLDILKQEGLSPSDVSTACPGDLLYQQLHQLRVDTGLHARISA